jgi:hypothetical protein
MFQTSGGASLGNVKFMGVSNRGFTPEELADNALDRIISISASADPIIRQQAEVFRESIRAVLISYGKQCIKSNNTTITNRLNNVGHPELIQLLEG